MKHDLAHALRQKSLMLGVRLFFGLFGFGAVLGVEQLRSGTDPMAFFAPFAVFLASTLALHLYRRGQFIRARQIFTGVNLLYVAALMIAAPIWIRIAIGFPLTCLVVFLLHLIYPSRQALRVGWLAVGLVAVGFGLLLVTEPWEWVFITGCITQVTVIGFANFVLGRLGMGWEQALDTTRDTQQELTHAYAIAVEASAAKSRFLASMSHELRTPLNAIIGYAELMEEDVEDEVMPDPVDLEQIANAGRHLLELVNQVLDLSRVESGRLELELEPVVLADVVREVTGTCKPQVTAQGNVLEVKLNPVPPLFADRLRVKQILTNLLANAAKFTTDGTVTVALAVVGERIVLAVVDTGCGIDPACHERIFEPFLQADGSIQRTHGGTGLGLAISRKLATEMGGRLTLESALGEGSRFLLSFPAEECRSTRADRAARARS